MAAACLVLTASLHAEVGDPQIRTDHPWYPGELALSDFPRLFATQAEQYQLMTGKAPGGEEGKALASWAFRNTHYAHGEEGAEDLWGKGFQEGDLRTREYWTGLFAMGFGLCGTTHSQWTAEMEHLIGHSRSRGMGVAGHNSFEVFLKGGAYGDGRWALLDHDLSTVIFDEKGSRLLSLPEVKADLKTLTDRSHNPAKQHGWLVCGLHPGDGGSYADYKVAEYLAGYAGPPPMVHLRRGETLRRYLQPGLQDGKTHVFWGRNYMTDGIPGPMRAETWVNQPQQMHGSTVGAGKEKGRARFGNAVYGYTPDFASGHYREAIASEDGSSVTFSFTSPYIIAATPPDNSDWGIYKEGCRNGLVLHGTTDAKVSVSVDRGQSWHAAGPLTGGMDLTDAVKGHRQYLLRLHSPAKALVGKNLRITTVCQANPAIMPWLKDGGNRIDFSASHSALVSAGPNTAQARAHIVGGAFGTPEVTMELTAPGGNTVTMIHAIAQMASGSPPSPEVKYRIEYSTDGGKAWKPVVEDWNIARNGEEPGDFWSQSFCYGSVRPDGGTGGKVRVCFSNDGGKKILRAELHLTHATRAEDGTKVTFAWQDDSGGHQQSHTFPASDGKAWKLPTGKAVKTKWVEFEPTAGT